MSSHNERFAVMPLRSEDMHRPLSVPVDKLTDILCHREQRYVGSQLTLSYDRKRIILERNATSEDLGGKYVDVYDFPDGRLEVRSKGLAASLPHLQQGSEGQPHCNRREQAPRPRPGSDQGTTGQPLRSQGEDQQREGPVSEARAADIRARLCTQDTRQRSGNCLFNRQERVMSGWSGFHFGVPMSLSME